jgi:CheY-like chemotaxis protein
MIHNGVEIMLIEDNPNDEMLALYALKSLLGDKSVHVERDGAAALDFIFHTGAHTDRPPGNPRLILLDKCLPLVDGMEVLRQIRADKATRLIPVVMLTASAEERDVVESYELGVNSYIIKPLDFEKFRETTLSLGRYWLSVNKQPVN